MGARLSDAASGAPPLAYLDRLSARAGERLELMASGEGEARLELVRLTGPGETHVLDGAEQTVALGPQPLWTGSYLRVTKAGPLRALASLTFAAWILPTLPVTGRPQGIFALARAGAPPLALLLDAAGRLVLDLGQGARLVAADAPPAGRWRFVAVVLDAERRRATLWSGDEGEIVAVESAAPRFGSPSGTLLLGALHDARADPSQPAASFNGKLAEPRLHDVALTREELTATCADGDAPDARRGLLARWDLRPAAGGHGVPDATGRGLGADEVNAPLRAVTGPRWRATEQDYRRDPAQWAAVHLHEDDLGDAGWTASAQLDVPDDAPSGVYAARLRGAGGVAWTPFVVRPHPRHERARVALLLPTYTYLAYANHRQASEAKAFGNDYSLLTHREVRTNEVDAQLAALPRLGLSLYESHADGTGSAISSRRRPLANLRPDYDWWMTGAPRHFGADLHLLAWLRQTGESVDVLTDEDLDREGPEALAGYRAVLTGSHPEYVTARMLDAFEDHLGAGGSLLYLGGNGFYWVTGTDRGRPHLIEVRRGWAGTRPWDSAPGEAHLQTTGEEGGLWRHRGRAPQRLVGVGFTSQGWGPGQGYRRTPDSHRPEAAALFAGIGEDELIGGFGAGLGGAAGDEIDRADRALGTPPDALVVATSAGRHSDHCQLALEDINGVLPGQGGTQRAEVRADVVLHRHSGGGVVFSVGSVNWVLSLLHDGGENNVARLTANALRMALDGADGG